MGTCSANLYKNSTDTKVTLTLQPIDRKATFTIDATDVRSKDASGGTVAVNKLPIGEKGFVSFTTLVLVCYTLQISTGYSTSARSIIS